MERCRILRRTVLIGAAALTVPSLVAETALSAEETTTPTVVVTATLIPTPIDAVGSAVTVIDAEEIGQKGYTTLTDALKSVPGITVRQSGGAGAQTSVFIRGAESRHTLFLLNGMNINEPAAPGAVFNPANLRLDNVERIEIIRGPQSVLYGSDAFGGVINVITKKGEKDWSVDARAEGGTLGTYAFDVGAGGTVGDLNIRVDGSIFHTEGHNIAPVGSEKDGYDNKTVSASLSAPLGDQFNAQVFGQYVWSETEFDSFGVDDFDNVSENDSYFLKGQVTGEFFDGRWRSTLSGNFSGFERVDNSFGVSEFESSIYEFGWRNDVDLHEGGILTVALESDIEEGVTVGAFQGIDDSFYVVSGLVQYQFDFWDRLSGTVGVRVDDHETFGTHPTYRVAASYNHLETGTRLRGAVATGFNAPTLVDLFGVSPGLFFGNPNLKPETVFSWEIGIEQTFWKDRALVGVTYFRNEFEDLIDPFSFDAMSGLFTAVNIDSAETHGIEAFVEVSPVEELDIRGSYTYLQTENLTTGMKLLRRPTHEFSGSIDTRPTDESRLGIDVIYVGEQADAGPAIIDDYVVVNAYAEYDATKNLTFFLRAKNLADEGYQDPIGFVAPGREILGGIKVKLP